MAALLSPRIVVNDGFIFICCRGIWHAIVSTDGQIALFLRNSIPRQLIITALLMMIGTGIAEASEKSRTLVAFARQTSKVQMSCFPEKLRSILGALSSRYGRQVIVTSGHRQTRTTRKSSLHRKCLAADIRIDGVSPTKVAQFARNLPGIGGVGTYCNGIVHVDVGARRDWRYCR